VAHDDWRIRIDLPEERAEGFLERLGLFHTAAEELADELRGRRLAASRSDDTVFVYAATPAEADAARDAVVAELREEGLEDSRIRLEQWLPDEDRWSDDPPGPTIEEDLVARGYAPWEVRVECSSHAEARALADRLEGDGYDVIRRWRYLIIGAASREEAEELADRVHGEVEPGGALVWESLPQNPFVVFGGLGSSGTPL
jgi:hypothetical protein